MQTARSRDELAASVRERLAYHEAGHAVIARAVGRELGGVTIALVGSDRYDGMVFDAGVTPDDAPALRDQGEEHCAKVIKTMPPIGESRLNMATWLEHARGSVMIYVAGELAERLLHGSELPRRPGSSDAISARMYAETVVYSPETVAAFVDYCAAEAEGLLRAHWRSVEALAAGLLQRGTLGPEEIDDAIRAGVYADQADQERHARASRR